jgi:hypothetical protein
MTELDQKQLGNTLWCTSSNEELREDSVVNYWLTTQTGNGFAAANHFRSVTQMVVRGKGSIREVNDEATQ